MSEEQISRISKTYLAPLQDVLNYYQENNIIAREEIQRLFRDYNQKACLVMTNGQKFLETLSLSMLSIESVFPVNIRNLTDEFI